MAYLTETLPTLSLRDFFASLMARRALRQSEKQVQALPDHMRKDIGFPREPNRYALSQEAATRLKLISLTGLPL